MKKVLLKDGSTFDPASGSYQMEDGAARVLPANLQNAMNNGFMDADGAIFFARQLEHIKAKSYDVKYAHLRARELFPVSNEGGEGVNTITYRTYDQVGAAKIIEAYADDLPRADISGKETSIPVRSVGTSYGYNVDEIAAAKLTGMPLDQRRANASRRAVEETINKIAFYGDASSGLPGLFTNPNIPKGNVVDPGAGTAWAGKTAEQILFDINDLFQDIFEATNMVEQANTLLLPPAQWGHIMSSPRSTTSDTTIAQYVVNNSPFLKSLDNIVPVNEMAAANNPTLTADAMMAYDKNPDKLQLEIPVELQYYATQMHNLEFTIPARARVAGLNIYYAMSMAIAEGI